MEEKMTWDEVLYELCTADGVPGNEKNIACTCAALLETYGSVKIDRSGSVLCSVGEQRPDRKTLLLNAHIDEVGMIVTYITDDGFLKVAKCGGVDVRVLPASKVTILGKERLYGIVTSVPPHLQSDSSKAAKLDDLYIDTGLSGKRAGELIKLGDRVLIENEPLEMGGLVTSKALDDRACVLALLMALDTLAGEETAYNIKVLLSAGEEVGSYGAKTGVYGSGADLALILDVTFGRVHGDPEEEYCGIGGGAAIGVSPTLSRRLTDALVKTAEDSGLPYQLEVMSGRTGTDADVISVSESGVPSCTISVPIRYMHTPVEAVDIADIENTAALIAEFCERGQF